MRLLRRSLVALFAPAALSAQAKPGQTLTLQDAIQMAQQQGPAAQVARSNRDAARWQDRAFNSRLLPQLFLNGTAANLNHGINAVPQPDGTSQYIGQSQNLSSFQLGFSQRVPLTGGVVSVGSQVSRFDQFGDNAARLYQTTPVVISLQQDLFKPRTVVWDERVQTLSASVAERGYLEARENVAELTADAFFNLYAAQMSLANAEANVSVNDTLYNLNKGRYEVGKIGENDLLKSELALLRARAAVDDARLSRDRAEAALRRTISFPEGESLSIVTPDSIPNLHADPDLAVREALKNSSLTEQSSLDLVRSRRDIAQAKADNRFNATIQASAGFNQKGSVLRDAYQSPLGKQTLSVGVNLPMIQWGAGKADVEAAKAGEQRALANNKSRRDQLAEDARFSALGLDQAQRNVIISAKADTVAAKQFEVARNRYIVSKISNTDLYTAQDQKDQAVLAKVQALRAYWTAYYHLRRVTLYDFALNAELTDVPQR